ncbi:bifunctional aminoglycoside phosphotransferase/ATP-binding protein [Rhodopseudomonas sp. BR0M22]|uniref:bifunctional aminoglycoside phosphotransferase/ATP-binding protein n=1 Tax=Rhodopseudomonas sp. BR0M22 TaxID=2269369 RepID=UPI0013DFEDFE|nr:bifunctional aminoglycoside phosphotransferase/ATP-binding protein [Rhodopseudomonas sp. BR0M22]NEW92202.1 DNA-binding protein [Rhodopseudomonas sp. BR0M22]
MPATDATADNSQQQEVFDFLRHGGDDDSSPAVQIDTHGAAVFLQGKRALKVKRAVKFPFLDYSTLTRRKTACEQELEVGRRFAPTIYRRVVPITRTDKDALQIGGDGPAVEWAVEMTRFDDKATLDHLARAGALGPELIDAVADTIAASHRAAPLAASEPWVASIEPIQADNTNELAAGGYAAADVTALDQASRAALFRLRPLLKRRGAAGFVRWCHGDLHLANIVIIDGKPMLFDAIEFDPAFASVDVLYDLAFPLMDLLHYGRGSDSAQLLNRYLAVTPEDNLDALSTLPLLLSMRAAIRAKVLLARPAADDATRRSNRSTADSYFALALRLIAPPPPRLIAVGGLSGTGKSVLARALSGHVPPLPGAVLLRSDVARKRLHGVADTERLPATAYTAEVTEAVYRGLAERAAHILKQGHSVIVDAVFARPDERQAIEATAAVLAVPFHGLFLTADLDTRIARVAGRTGDASDATPEIARQQQSYARGVLGWTEIDASGTPADTLDRALTALRRTAQVCST